MRRLRWPALLAVVAGLGVALLVYGTTSALTAVGIVTALWVILSSLWVPVSRLFGKGPRLTQSMLAMQLAHVGVGLFVLGVTVTSSFSIETDQRILPGESLKVAGYEFVFNGMRERDGANYRALQAEIVVSREDGEAVATLYPEKRIYRVQKSPMTEADIEARWARDLFVAMGENLGEGAWSVRIQYKPLIRLIWVGCLVMALGGVVAVTDRRYRRATSRQSSQEVAPGSQPVN